MPIVVCTTDASSIYRPRRPRLSPLYQLIETYYPEFQRTYGQRYQQRYGPWRPIIGEVIRKFLTCGDLHFGFARVRCPDCRHELENGKHNDKHADGTPPIDRAALDAQRSTANRPRAGSPSTWAMLIKRVYEIDPLQCPKCGGAMKIISFIERRQREVIERILRHCNLWQGPVRTLANARGPPSISEQDPGQPRELQLVLDPEFL